MRLRLSYGRLLLFFNVLWILILLWSNIFNIYDLRNTGIIDTSTFIQSVLSAFLREPFVNTVPGNSYFSVHASPILILILPFVSVFKNVVTLYAIQYVLTYGASIPLFLLARSKLSDDRTAFFIALTYLFFPYIAPSPFEVLTLFMGLFIFTYYFFDTRRYKAFAVALTLSLSTIEFNSLIGVSFGLYLLAIFLWEKFKPMFKEVLRKGQKGAYIKFLKDLKTLYKSKYFQISYFVILLSLGFFELDKYMISYFSAGTHTITENLAHSNISSINSIIANFSYDLSSKFSNIMYLNIPYMFISFLSPFALLELPWFLASGITSFPPYWTAGVYYDSYIIPFVAISAVLGFQKLSIFIKDSKMRVKVIRRLSYITFFITIVLFLSIVASPIISNHPVPVPQDDQGISSLAGLIPTNQSVFTGVNELPIVSDHVPNTWYYGPPRNYTLFNVQEGTPFPLSGYGFLAAQGSYALYERNYTGTPHYNNLLINSTFETYSQGERMNSIYSTFIPQGNYSICLSGNYTPDKSVIDQVNSGNSSYEFLSDNYALIYPFQFNSSMNLKEIEIDSRMTYGVYDIQAMITPALSVSNYLSYYCSNQFQYKFTGENAYIDVPIKGNTTYYLWLWSSGSPGGLYFPVHKGVNSTYVATIYSGSGTSPYGMKISDFYNLTSSDLNPQITFIGSSSSGEYYPTNAMLSMGFHSQSLINNITISGAFNYSYKVDLPSGCLLNLTFSSGLVNGTLLSGILIKSSTYRPASIFTLQHPYLIFYILVVISLVFLFMAFIPLNFERLNLLKSSSYLRILLIGMTISFAVYFAAFAAYYFYVLSNMLPLVIFGFLSSILFVIYTLLYFIRDVITNIGQELE